MVRKFQQLNLWPRLAIAVTLGFLVLFGVFSLLSLRAVNDSTNRILRERLVISKMAAQELDRMLEGGFHELEKATEFAAFDPRGPSLAEEYHVLAHSYGRIGTFSLGVYFLDTRARVVMSQPPGRLPPGTDLSGEDHIMRALNTRQRSVSDPFADPVSGKPAVALTVPVLNADGGLVSMLSGLIDVSSPYVASPLKQARDLGHTGHAELVDSRGLIIASTDYGGFLQPGEHLPFYLSVFESGVPGVKNVPYAPWHPVPETGYRKNHVMAFAPISAAPWGVAVGGADWETFAPVSRLRNTILVSGAASLAFLWLLTLIGARVLVRPVRKLTWAARRMATGDLEQVVRVGEGGEIGIMAESLETMRMQMKEAMEKARLWGKELEARVQERTEELSDRNRQLAAITAVAMAANDIRNQEGMLGRCLEVVLEHTRMEAAAIRLADGAGGPLAAACAGGELSALPCWEQAVSPTECPCGYVVSTGVPLYLSPEERQGFRPVCRAPDALSLAVLPLKSPKEVLGVLYLASSVGDVPGPEERDTLEAICNQIAIAIDNARLLDKLGQVQAQRELDRMKAEFISAISHELRTPLGFITGYATTLLRDDIAVDAGTQKEFLQIIDEESQKLQRMIDELLDASRLQAGRLHVERTPISLKVFLKAALHKASLALVQAGHSLQARLPAQDAEVLADPTRIEQVLHNLLDNAARYSDPGTPIEVAATVDGGHAMVSVTDHGDGIPQAELERIFEPFYRGANSRGARGAGLGLTICRGILESHGGNLWVESSQGQGSTFLFSLPLVCQDPGLSEHRE